jgi:hypothetical protein
MSSFSSGTVPMCTQISCVVALVTTGIAIGLAAGVLQLGNIVTAIGFAADVVAGVAAWQACLWEANERAYGCHGLQATWGDIAFMEWCDNVVYPWSAEPVNDVSDVPMAE